MRVLVAIPWRPNCASLRLIHQLVPQEKSRDVVWFAPPSAVDVDASLRQNLFNIEPFPRSRLVNSVIFRARLYRLGQEIVVNRRVKQMAARLKDVIARSQPDVIWGLGHSQQVLILDEALRGLSVPFHLSVHDEPVAYAWRDSKWPHRQANSIERAWPRLLARAHSIDSVSAGMRSHLKEHYGRDSDVFMPCPRYQIRDVSAPPLDGIIRIGLSGSDTAISNVHALISGLDKWIRQNKLRGGEILWLAGPRLAVATPPTVKIETVGYLDEEEGIERLRQCQLLYLPYTFDDDYVIARRTAFPSKLSMYLPACRPILFHAPTDSTLADFSQRNGLGALWTNLEDLDVLPLLDKLVTECQDIQALGGRYGQILQSELNIERNRSLLWTQLAQFSSFA